MAEGDLYLETPPMGEMGHQFDAERSLRYDALYRPV